METNKIKERIEYFNKHYKCITYAYGFRYNFYKEVYLIDFTNKLTRDDIIYELNKAYVCLNHICVAYVYKSYNEQQCKRFVKHLDNFDSVIDEKYKHLILINKEYDTLQKIQETQRL